MRGVDRLQVPILRDLAEQTERRGLDTVGVALVDRISVAEHGNGAVAGVFVLDSAEHVVEQALAKRGRGNPHLLDAELLEHGA